MRYPRSTTRALRADRSTADGPTTHASALAESLAVLRAAVAGHVAARRTDGVPLERVLGEVSGLVARAELLEGSSDELGILLTQVRRWSLDAYFDEPELQNAPRFY